ncbi:hypothetical protein N8772_01905 [Rickettsiales bacterium]|nr:hypothetical protein [Rickettsiales bacterium]
MFRILFTIIIILFSKSSFSEINLVIDDFEIPKITILFQGCDDEENNKEAIDVVNNIEKNINTTNLFDIQYWPEHELYQIKDEVSDEYIMLYDKYSEHSIDAILQCSQNIDQENKANINFKLWDILDEDQILSKNYIYNDNISYISNDISDDIFTKITREKKGHFNSKIAYIAESGEVRKRKKRVATINFDGSNLKYVTNGKNLALTPRFANDPNKLTILLYQDNTPSLFNLNISQNSLQKLSNFKGTTMSADVHPKNSDLVIFSAIDSNGNSDVYSLDYNTGIRKRLTFSRSIETTSSFSPSGNNIIFTSDKTGRQEIYQMDINGENTRKISNSRGDYSKPVWSPDGSLIAFTKIIKGKFVIGVMTSQGYNERILTSGYVVEGVSWSPNSRYLIYSRKNSAFGKGSIPKLYIIDIVTGYERIFPTPANEGATDPDWIELPQN